MRKYPSWGQLEQRLIQLQKEAEQVSISPTIFDILLAAEDHRFFKHRGVDPIALCRAFWRTVFCGKREGGSTIAMQLVRVLSGNYEKTISRKLIEIHHALKLSRRVKKSQVPILYLLVAYFGANMNGITQLASQLSIELESISKLEAARIVARLKYPEPKKCSEKRRDQINSRASHILIRADTYFPVSKRKYNRIEANGSV